MFFNRKKKIYNALKTKFGQLKTEGFNFDLIKRYHKNKLPNSEQQILSDQTCNDLDFDLFFCFADRTTSKVGQQYLYNRLRTLEFSHRKTVEQENLVNYLTQNQHERLSVQYELQKLNQYAAYYIADLFQKEPEQKSKWYFIIPLLSFTAIASLVLSFLNPQILLFFLGVFPINVFLHYRLKRKTNLFVNSIPALLTMGSVAKNLLKFKFIKTNDSKIENSITTITSIKRKMSLFKLEQKVDSDMELAYWFILEIFKIAFLLEPLLLYSSLNKLQNKAKDIEQVFQFIGNIDLCISIASLRKGLNEYCLPEIKKNQNTIHFDQIRHPLISDCVPNSISSVKSILLTGSNMSGKTTFIRSIGLNYISGIALNTCFAVSATLPTAKIYSVIRIEDDLLSSSSYFYKEVDEIKNIILEIKKNESSIVLLDELFKGTNTKERIAAAKSVLSYLSKFKGQIFVATHDIELTEMLTDQFELFHFSEAINNSKIHFDYKLKRGIPLTGNAIRILKFNDFPDEMIEEATAILNKK